MRTEERDLSVELMLAPAGTVTGPDAALASADVSFEPWVDAAGRDSGYCVERDDGYHVRLYGVGAFVLSGHSGAVRGTPEPGVAPEAFYDAFCRYVVPLVLQRHSWEALHANGIGMAGGCVALCGRSETGKSTLAYAWRRRGGRVYADDALLFRLEESAVAVRSVPFRIRLRPPALRHFGAAGVEPESLAGGRPHDSGSDRPDLRAIYLLDRRRDDAEGPVLLEAVSPARALSALLQQAFCLTLRDRTRNRTMVENYLTLVERVPTFRLSYPTGLGHVEAILDLLATQAQGLATGGATLGEPCPGMRVPDRLLPAE